MLPKALQLLGIKEMASIGKSAPVGNESIEAIAAPLALNSCPIVKTVSFTNCCC
jgi:hypothetical protein